VKEENPGFFGSVTGGIRGVIENLRTRRLQVGRRENQTRFVPANGSEQSLELEQQNSRTQRQYDMLAKRRSML
jgi:hypothetical protein